MSGLERARSFASPFVRFGSPPHNYIRQIAITFVIFHTLALARTRRSRCVWWNKPDRDANKHIDNKKTALRKETNRIYTHTHAHAHSDTPNAFRRLRGKIAFAQRQFKKKSTYIWNIWSESKPISASKASVVSTVRNIGRFILFIYLFSFWVKLLTVFVPN